MCIYIHCSYFLIESTNVFMFTLFCGVSEVKLQCEQQFTDNSGHNYSINTGLLTSIRAMSSRKAQQPLTASSGAVVRSGYLRKCGSVVSRIKPLKKKYFVLRGNAPGHPACLEYYDSKKKFENKHPPKRSIVLQACYNINRRSDTKQKYVIALYTKIDCFSMILDNEKDLDEWLTEMLLLSGDGVATKPHFEHVWEVTMENEGLGEKNNCRGPWRVCLTDRVLTLIKLGAEDDSDCLEFPLTTIRLIGLSEWSKTTFVIQVGRSSVTGEGEFLMTFEDPNNAQNMHDVIMAAMLKSSKNNIPRTDRNDDLGPQGRLRSCSANEASKPISVLGGRRPAGHKPLGFSPLDEQRCHEDGQTGREHNVTASAPSQSSQSQNSPSTNTLTVVAVTRSLGTYGNGGATSKRRRHSLASQSISTTIKSQSIFVTSTSIITNAVPTTTTTTINNTITTTATKSHQRTLSLPLAAVIYQTQSSKRSVLRCPAGRDRCDSLPSRARTTSEGHPAPMALVNPRSTHLVPHSTRPHSMYSRGISYSPPISSMPISPASGACSTDSAGSSLSMDDGTESMHEESVTTRYGHSLTPEEPVILEENPDDYAPWSATNQVLKYSPNCKSHSPSQQNSYVDMYSPCGSSPGRGGVYLPMSPATTVHSHSRASSLVEETAEGYVPMAPVGDDGYVDMNASNSSHNDPPNYEDTSRHGSSCSVTSGTPSTDLRFIEYTLDKVPSFITPSDDVLSRPTRAYSVGSRPEPANRHRKNRLDIAQQEANRVRAFSVGSRSKRPELCRLMNVITAKLPSGNENVNPNKSNSAPLLSSSWGHNSGCSSNSERMADLMEMDFTKTNVSTTLSSTPSSYSQPHSYSAATDMSSYVDMSFGQSGIHASTALSTYVDMSGSSKINRMNNNNITTANHNHNHILSTTSVSTVAHKPIIKTLKPVVEAESSYMMMGNSLTNEWIKSESSKQSPTHGDENYMEMNGPPGLVRTAPVDLPQPRKPTQLIDGYVEMSYKPRPNLEQNYINMTVGTSSFGTRVRRKQRPGSRKDKSQRSQPIAIQASNKSTKAPSFLSLNGSSTSESLASTPATPPAHATPTGSNATIFPFSLNSPQSPTKIFTRDDKVKSAPTSSDCSPDHDGDYALMTPTSLSNPIELNSMEESSEDLPKSPASTSPSQQKLNSISAQESPISPLSKRLTDLSVTKKPTRNSTTSPVMVCLGASLNSLMSKDDCNRTTETTKSLKRERESDKIPTSPTGKDQKGSQNELPQSPVMKKLSELSVSKAKLIGSSPNISPTPPSSVGLKAAGATVKNISKVPDDSVASTPTVTPAASPSPLDSEGYEKLQPGATLLHYASLDLPESTNAPPVSPTSVQDGFRYAEIDFAKLKQN